MLDRDEKQGNPHHLVASVHSEQVESFWVHEIF